MPWRYMVCYDISQAISFPGGIPFARVAIALTLTDRYSSSFGACSSMPVFRLGQTWDAFRDLEREVDRLFHGVNLTFQGIRFGRQFPAINVYELENEFLLTAELPGTRPEDLELTIAGGMLTIKGRRGEQDGVPEDRFRRQERFRGAWQRSVNVPERVREEEITSDFNQGVLKIHLPKAAELKPRQIRIAEGNE
jgi:HSP20 family protein